jgi:hypothetical protein
MVLKKLDILSPPVTFYYKGVLSHPSFVSGIISILAFIIIISFAVYYSLFIIMRKNPKTYYFSSFTNDAGVFPINSSSFFHFISMSEDSDNPTDKGVNFENFRILGFDIYYYYAYINGSINNFDHWLYGYCNNDSDVDGISNLINQQYFEKSACIRKYFSQKDQKYYDTGNINFKWPEMAHGTFNKNKTYYSVILERCREDTIDLVLGKGHHCKNDTELDEILSHHGVVHFNFIDNYIDALNYSYPVTKYFYRVENSLDKDHYTINHLNFNPSLVKTNYGLFWDRYSQETSYSYERNDAFTYELGEEKIYMGYYLWLNNKLFYSERIYQRVQDVLSNIGGIFQAIFLAASLVNSLYNKYIVLIDTEKLLSSSVEKEKDYKPKNAKFEKAKKVLKNKTSELDEDKSNNTLKNINEKHNLYNSKSNKLINSNKEKDNLKNDYYNFKTDYKNINNNYNKEENKIEKEKNNDDNKNKIENYKEKNFWSYFCYKISNGKKNNNFRIYESFRTKIISEEHLIRNYLNIYNLLKVSKKKLYSRRKSYHLKDLINLV